MANYTISDIEGIGPSYAAKLRKAGIKTTNALLDNCATRRGRKELASETGLDESLILKWVNMADLYRVRGIGSEYAELLEKAGVDTVKELKQRKPENLTEALEQANRRGRANVRALPGERRVKAWVSAAKKLSPKVQY